MKKTPLLDKSEKRLHFPEANVFKIQKKEIKDYIEKSEKKNASVIIKLFLASNGIVTIAVDLEYDA